MELREYIISMLDSEVNRKYPNYYYTKKSLVTNSDINLVDIWFKGVIESLFYNPNHTALILEGPREIGKSYFFDNLFPDDFEPFTIPHIYKSLIYEIEFTKNNISMIEKDNFIILEENAKGLVHPATDKRLCSYYSTTNRWHLPQRKSAVVIKLEKIKLDLFDSINKLELWQEIFHLYKPKTC